jgi:hypothetical protein
MLLVLMNQDLLDYKQHSEHQYSSYTDNAVNQFQMESEQQDCGLNQNTKMVKK